jgi:hypothetical protein
MFFKIRIGLENLNNKCGVRANEILDEIKEWVKYGCRYN